MSYPLSRARAATFSIQFARRMLAAAVSLGASPAELLAAARLDPQLLVDPDGRLSLEQVHALLDAIERSTGEDFGLAAARMHSGAPDTVLGLAVHTSRTLGEAYRRVSRYAPIICDTLEIRVERAGDHVTLTHHQRSVHGAHPRAVEYSLAMLHAIGRKALGERFAPIRVTFEHRAPASTAAQEAFFGIAPSFGAPANELVVDGALIDAPMRDASEEAATQLDRLLEEVLRALPRPYDFIDRVRAAIAAEMRGGTPTLESIAARLRMVPRTLQRRLRQGGGKGFNDLRDELRRELAQRYLARPGIALAEVSYLLGFSEPSTFHRAFRRWTGTTPDAFRRAQGAA